MGLWLFGLAWAVSLVLRRFTEKTMLRMERGSGLILFGLAHGI